MNKTAILALVRGLITAEVSWGHLDDVALQVVLIADDVQGWSKQQRLEFAIDTVSAALDEAIKLGGPLGSILEANDERLLRWMAWGLVEAAVRRKKRRRAGRKPHAVSGMTPGVSPR